jgi:hypothetical protein
MQRILFIALISISISLFGQKQDEFITFYESSNFLETPRYDATIAYAKKLANASEYIQYQTFGLSAQGRALPLLVVNKNKHFTPQEVRESGQTILLIEACIHPGESEGKEAGLMLLRDMLVRNQFPELLDNVTILFIPIFNTDGHERFSKYSRINQNGPMEMGWRTTARNYDLNRDFIKADAVEMKQWLRLFQEWLPDMFVDVHTTDGADYQYAMTYGMHTQGEMDKAQTDWQKHYLKDVEEKLKKDDVLMFPYVAFRRWHDPRSGLIRRTASPRFSTGYMMYQNRPALLVETHMLKDYKTRVNATYHLLKHTLEILNKDHKHLQEININADKASEELAGQELILNYTVSKKDSSMVLFKGVDYKIVDSDLTDDIWVQFSDKPKDYNLVLFDKLEPTLKVTLPEAYIIPVQWTEVIERLDLHGIKYETLEERRTMKVASYQFSEVVFAQKPYEGRHIVKDFKLTDIEHEVTYEKGSVIVPTNQRTAKIIAHILEPKGPDSFVHWGLFNSIFERKEYVETYVMEKMAREMIKKQPELLEQYKAAIKADPEQYNNQWAKLYWFYAKTPYWDQEKDIYPVGKIL